jgi:hypothetical protein
VITLQLPHATQPGLRWQYTPIGGGWWSVDLAHRDGTLEEARTRTTAEVAHDIAERVVPSEADQLRQMVNRLSELERLGASS